MREAGKPRHAQEITSHDLFLMDRLLLRRSAAPRPVIRVAGRRVSGAEALGAFASKVVDIAGQKVSFQAGPRWYAAGPDAAPGGGLRCS